MRIDLKNKEDLSCLCECMLSDTGYWACLGNDTEDYQKTEIKIKQSGKTPYIEDVLSEMLLERKPITIWETEEDGELGQEHDLTIELLTQGVETAVVEGYWDGDMDSLDGEAGDIILQLSLLKDIVYG